MARRAAVLLPAGRRTLAEQRLSGPELHGSRHEAEYGHEAQVRFSRWQGPIRLKLINEFGDKALQAEVVKVQSQHLARITGHPIQLVNDNPNLTLIMTRHQQMASWAGRTMRQDDSVNIALKEGICLANFATNARYEITRATIIIPVDYSRAKGRFLDCVVEELTQVMGLPNDSNKVFPSIFNDNSIDSFPPASTMCCSSSPIIPPSWQG